MVRIADLINAEQQERIGYNDIVVHGDCSLKEVLDLMIDQDCAAVGVKIDPDQVPLAVTKEQVFDAILQEMENIQSRLVELEEQIAAKTEEQLEMMQCTMSSLAELERNKLEIAVRNMSEGMIILDKNGQVEKVNQSAKDLLNMETVATLSDIGRELDRLGLRELIDVSTGERRVGGEFRLQVKGKKLLLFKWLPIKDEWGNSLGKVLTFRDITREVAAENTTDDFIAAISHELRITLTSIQN